MRTDIKRMIKDASFWSYFPEYVDYKKSIKKKGCCNLDEKVYNDILSWIQKNPIKWKSYLKCDSIRIYPQGHMMEV